MLLTEKEAFLTMFYFLDAIYDETKSDFLGEILGPMQVTANGKPIDLAYWQDWAKAMSRVVREKE